MNQPYSFFQFVSDSIFWGMTFLLAFCIVAMVWSLLAGFLEQRCEQRDHETITRLGL